jgi:hypothetical protein
MLAVLGALLFGFMAGERVAVIVHDPGGHGDELALSVVQRLRAEGWDAMAVPPSSEPIDNPHQQDLLAQTVGASRVLVLDLVTQRRRQVSTSAPQPSNPPSAMVWRFEVREPQPATEIDTIEMAGPPLPPSATHAPRVVQEEVHAQTRVRWRHVGNGDVQMDHTVGTAAMMGWSEDRAPLRSRAAAEHERFLLRRLSAEVAGQTAELLEMK